MGGRAGLLCGKLGENKLLPLVTSQAQEALQSHLFRSSAASFNDRLPFFPLYVSNVF